MNRYIEGAKGIKTGAREYKQYIVLELGIYEDGYSKETSRHLILTSRKITIRIHGPWDDGGTGNRNNV